MERPLVEKFVRFMLSTGKGDGMINTITPGAIQFFGGDKNPVFTYFST